LNQLSAEVASDSAPRRTLPASAWDPSVAGLGAAGSVATPSPDFDSIKPRFRPKLEND
jgi:hypothetical protein